MMDWNSFIPSALGALGGAITAYVAIRSDIAELRAKIAAQQESINRIHNWIDRGK